MPDPSVDMMVNALQRPWYAPPVPPVGWQGSDPRQMVQTLNEPTNSYRDYGPPSQNIEDRRGFWNLNAPHGPAAAFGNRSPQKFPYTESQSPFSQLAEDIGYWNLTEQMPQSDPTTDYILDEMRKKMGQ